jgi:molybdopterin synthase catalytic subunit
LFFGILKELTGQASAWLQLPEGATLGDVLEHYGAQSPRMKEFLPSIAASVNQEYAAGNTRLKDEDEVGLLPPVSGGQGAGTETDHRPGRERAPRAAIVRERIDVNTLSAGMRAPEDGALVVFDGMVRNNSRGRRTLYLDYEAYEEMALRQLESLATEAMAKFKVRDVAIVHRVGRLEIGETSVAIVVSSAHRAAAFEACRWVIDTLKTRVPIWKKEYFEDGAVWADGEPFPSEIVGR